MPVHDWTRVGAAIFHHFHQGWIGAIASALNHGLLPPDTYALAEQIAGGLGPDVLTLEAPTEGPKSSQPARGGVALLQRPPRVRFRDRTETDQYAAKANLIAIRHSSDHRVIAILEIVSPGNKSTRQSVRRFVDKAYEFMRAGVHLLIVDVFPSGKRDPEGIHKEIWNEWTDNNFVLPIDKRLTLVSYISGPCPEAFIEPIAIGDELPDMPLFLNPGEYVDTPLEATYDRAWETVPAYWRKVLTSNGG